MNKPKSRLKTETNPTVYNRLARSKLGCPHCRPHKDENAKRKPKHGKAKPKKTP